MTFAPTGPTADRSGPAAAYRPVAPDGREHLDLADLVREAARRDQHALAVVGPDVSLTYGELDAAADALADELDTAGVRRRDRVVLWLDKSAAAVVAMQAVLRLGAVYVPLDGSNPPPRAARVVADCAAALVMTSGDRAEGLRARLAAGPPVTHRTPIHLLDGLPAGARPVADRRARRRARPDDLAYILYTSGSTGDPKGVCITHSNAWAFIRWAAGELAARPDDRLANHAPFNFDLSVLDLYVTFLAGASVHLVPSAMAFAAPLLVEFLHARRITIWYSVPSALVLMIRSGGLLARGRPEALRALLFAGEPFPVTHLAAIRRAWDGVRLLNLYGPTETNVCTFHEVRDLDLESGRPIPIGRACSGDEVWVARPDGRPITRGEEGELLVQGPTVMAGYWGRPAHHGPYATGDIVRQRADGLLEYVGRGDDMVKVRGHRVELGEIETALVRHDAVGQAAVIVAGVGADRRLVAFVVADGDPPSLLALKRHCAGLLPRYMIIDEVRVLDALPCGPNGKIDRRRLAARVADPAD